MSASLPAPEPRRAARSSNDRLLGGVCAGLADHLAVPVLWVRVAFLVATTLGGLGAMVYAGLWMVLPTDARFVDDAPGLAAATRQGRRPRPFRRFQDAGQLVALSAIGIGVLVLVGGVFGQGWLVWPLIIGAAGLAMLWRQADDAQQERWLDSSGRLDPLRLVLGRGGWQAYTRIAAGVALLLIALVVFAVTNGGISSLGTIVLAGVLGVGGLGLVVGPWLFRLAGELTDERAERIRSQERADVAAHLHDSVLQTLALIQKNAGDGASVAKLARAQERDLRAWLFATDVRDDSTVASALRAAAAEVEDTWGVPVEVVAVGDGPVGERTRALVLAAREAMVNAARHSGAAQVDVYVEVAGGIEVYVRDRGVGFDPSAVPADRRGVSHSIVDRVTRHGGVAEVRTSPGEGTEVRLSLPGIATTRATTPPPPSQQGVSP